MNTYLYHIFRCPECYFSGLNVDSKKNEIICSKCNAEFPFFKGRPVLIQRDNNVFPRNAYTEGNNLGVKNRKSILMRLMPGNSVNLSNANCLASFREIISKQGSVNVLVIGGGTQRVWLDERFEVFPNINLVYTDIDVSALVDCYCDAHELPFIDSSFDGVITTAVLEHVLYPERVSEEIARVLKLGGLLYSELPFMQQVHEGAYDFTRYTLSGHRRLFNQFLEIKSGMVAGPGTALAWSLENFFLAFFSGIKSRLIVKGITRLMTFWVKYFDYLFRNRPQAMDAASCTYFFGRKQESRVPDSEIIERYVGRKHLHHI